MHKGRNAARIAVATVLVATAVGIGGPASAGPGANDFTGDNRADLMALYDYGNGEASLFAFPGTQQVADNATGPREVWHADRGNFWPSVSKITSGDFDGNGFNDVLAMYDYGNGAAGLWVFPGTAGSGPGASGSYLVWEVGPGNFWLSAMKITSGDFNDDGRADVLALYDYGHESAGLFVFPGTTGSGPTASQPYQAWYTGRGGFDANRAKIVAGDFTLDGRDDLVALYDYGNAEAGLWIFPGTSGSAPGATVPYMSWEGPPGSYDVRTVHTVEIDDLDNDGTVDFIAIASGAVYRFPGTPNAGTAATAPVVYTWNTTGFPAIVGDYDGNGVVDLITLVDHGGGAASLWVLAGGQPINQVHLWVRVWYTGYGNFWPSVVKIA